MEIYLTFYLKLAYVAKTCVIYSSNVQIPNVKEYISFLLQITSLTYYSIIWLKLSLLLCFITNEDQLHIYNMQGDSEL